MTVVDNAVLVDVLLARVPWEQMGDGPFDAPALIDAEFVHVLRWHNRVGTVDDTQAHRLLRRFGGLSIQRHPLKPLIGRAFELRHNLLGYDAMYVALAEALDTTLLTTDARIARASGIRCAVEVL